MGLDHRVYDEEDDDDGPDLFWATLDAYEFFSPGKCAPVGIRKGLQRNTVQL